MVSSESRQGCTSIKLEDNYLSNERTNNFAGDGENLSVGSSSAGSSNEFCMQISFDFNRVSYTDHQSNFVIENGAKGPDLTNGGESGLFSGAVPNAGGSFSINAFSKRVVRLQSN